MCNIAGYVGARRVAPILIDMIRIQEGLNGGFYTGLAVHDGASVSYRVARCETGGLKAPKTFFQFKESL